ncbi:MAG: response regulator transcription factor [Chloroflexota bacterium]|nr:response regulator transcription factor [Chloroflexota bacterium]
MDGNRGIPAGAGVLVVDPSGIVFSLLRAAKLGIALWRITSRAQIPDLAGIGLTVVAAYDRPDWILVARLVDQTPTVIVTSAPYGEDAGRAVALGASGYISAALAPDAMRRAVLGAIRGEPAFSRRVLAERLRLVTKPQFSGSALVLTPRQREVVTLIARGAADKEIARTLGITTATAQKHVTNVLKRLNVPNRAAAAAALVSSTTWHSAANESVTPTLLEAAAS